MKLKYFMIICIFLIAITTIGTVSASGNITSDELAITDDIQITEVGNTIGNFSELSTLIEESETGSTINLTKDYTNNAEIADEIVINKEITINGQNHIIDANYTSQLLSAQSDNIVLKNIIIKNVKDYNYISSPITLYNCSIINWTATTGSTLFEGTVYDCQFINCNSNGGCVNFKGDAYSTKFINCHATLESYLFVGNGAYCTLINCSSAENINQAKQKFINSTFKNFIDSRDDPKLTFTYTNITEGEILRIEAKYKDDAGEELTITIANITKKAKLNYQSIAIAEITGLKAGNYTLTISYPGNELYTNMTKIAQVEVKGKQNGTFTDLFNEIDETESGKTLILTKDYVYQYTPDYNCIMKINKPLTIDGKGHIIYGDDMGTLFGITSENVVFKNIIFNKVIGDNPIEFNAYNCTFLNINSYADPFFKGDAYECKFIDCFSIPYSHFFIGTAYNSSFIDCALWGGEEYGLDKLINCTLDNVYDTRAETMMNVNIKNPFEGEDVFISVWADTVEPYNWYVEGHKWAYTESYKYDYYVYTDLKEGNYTIKFEFEGDEFNRPLNTSYKFEVKKQTFEDAQKIIDETPENETIYLYGHYYSTGNPIIINKSITIGRNKNPYDSLVPSEDRDTIFDGLNLNRIFKVINGTLTLKHMTLTNGNAINTNENESKNGGAIYSLTSSLKCEECNFINNSANEGGAIYSIGNIKISDSTFEKNHAAEDGSCIKVINTQHESTPIKSVEIMHSTFKNNLGSSSVINITSDKFIMKLTTLINNTAKFSVIHLNCKNANITNSTFINNAEGLLSAWTNGLTIDEKKYDNIISLDDNLQKIYYNTASAPSTISTTYKSTKTLDIEVQNSITKETESKINILLKVYTGSKYITYDILTNSKGIVNFQTSKLGVGTHKIEISSKENLFKTIKSSVKVNKAKTTIKAPKVTAKYKKSKYFQVSVKNQATKKSVTNTYVKVKIDKKTYKIKTNSKGVAKINTKSLKIGKHNVVISSGNSNYIMSAKSTIVIKK